MFDRASHYQPIAGACLSALSLILCSTVSVGTLHSLAAASEDQYVPLFNGQNLGGFYSWLVDSQYEDPRHVFSVMDGQIRISGDGLGYLATGRVFQDYDLIVEYRWGDTNTHWGNRIGKARDSGLFLNATGSDGNSVDGDGAFMAAIECNIFQGATGDILLIRGETPFKELIAPEIDVTVSPIRDQDGWYTWAPTGQLVTVKRWGRINWLRKSKTWQDRLDFRGQEDHAAAYGSWNRLDIQCRPDRISIALNGHPVNQVTPRFPQAGRILLQCEGSEIFFRRLDIRLLADAH